MAEITSREVGDVTETALEILIIPRISTELGVAVTNILHRICPI